MVLNELINTIESVAPLKWQEAWDNSGLQVGDRNADIDAALLTTDVTESVVDEAIRLHCGLIVSHHPLLFFGLKNITGDTPQQRIVEKAIRNNIAIYSSHTAMDSYLHGVSGRIAEKIGLTDVKILNPVDEQHGLGVIGQLPEPVPFMDLLAHIKKTFQTTYIRYIAPLSVSVQTIALCGGAGAEFAEQALQQGADVYITADCKYHEFVDLNGRIGLIDIDHWISEHFTRDIFRELLEKQIKTYISQEDKTPIKIF
ncbi:MAG: Nif3-like dinuclear metal center hexameric protein [Paludibacteraceae bacterium]|nr:Nif3-like dinuclear metal center hexameric protein [Paludibacteraceae bacterium]